MDSQWLHDRAPTGPAKMRNVAIRAPIAPAASLNNKLVVSNLHYEITPKDLIVRFPFLSFFLSPTSAHLSYNLVNIWTNWHAHS